MESSALASDFIGYLSCLDAAKVIPHARPFLYRRCHGSYGNTGYILECRITKTKRELQANELAPVFGTMETPNRHPI